MEKIEKLKKVVDMMKLKVASIERKLNKEFGPSGMEKMKLEFEKAELNTSISNIERYMKRLELIEKVKKYENNSRRS